MIKAVFHENRGSLYGFRITGHSGLAESGSDIICAAVSSAAYMTVNTVTEILGCDIDAQVDDGFMDISLSGSNAAASDILKGLRLHLSELAKEYPDFIKISTEV